MPWAFCCRLASCASLARSGTATSTCARLSSCAAAPGFDFCSRMNSSISRSPIFTFGSSSRSRSRVSSSSRRRSARNSSRVMPSAAMRWRISARLIWFCRATICSAWSIAASSTLMPISLANCNCARSEINRSSTSRASSGRGRRAASALALFCSTRATRNCTSELVIGSELTTATMYSAERCWVDAAGVGGRAGRIAGARAAGLRIRSVMPRLRPGLAAGRVLCWACASDAAASRATQARVKGVRTRCFMMERGVSQS